MRLVISDGNLWRALRFVGHFTFNGQTLDGRDWVVIWRPGASSRVVRSCSVQHVLRRDQ